MISVRLNLRPADTTQAPLSPSLWAQLGQFSLWSPALADREGVGLVSVWQQHKLGVLTEQTSEKVGFIPNL